MSYLARVTECEHGEIEPHAIKGFILKWIGDCPGGTTTRIEPDYEAAARAIDAEVKKWPTPPPSGLVEPGWWGATTLELAKVGVDAALGGTEE